MSECSVQRGQNRERKPQKCHLWVGIETGFQWRGERLLQMRAGSVGSENMFYV